MIKRERNFENRKRLIIGFMISIVLIYLIQLFVIQIVDKDYKTFADSNAFLKKTLYPSRGTIYDRNGKLLVYNQPAYDVMVVVREMQAFDTLHFCNIVNMPVEQFKKRLADIKDRRKNPGYSSYLPQAFLTQLGNKEYGLLQEALYKFPGFYILNRTAREYAYPCGAHALGYVAPVDKQGMRKDDYYASGDYAGKAGVEKSYETYLRGEKGVEILLRNAHGSIKGKYEEGKYDKEPVSGKNLTLSIDVDLQKYGEELMQNKLGSIIMIEPSTGEILCMVASPTYDPSMLIGGRAFSENFQTLAADPYKPLLNRAMTGGYPPGSTFKPAQALAFLEEGIIEPTTQFGCNGGFPFGNSGKRQKCHAHPSPLPLVPALATSCNAYFSWGLKSMLENKKKYGKIGNAIDRWRDLMLAQGYGRRLGADIPGERGGFIPGSQRFNKEYRDKNNVSRWNAYTVISIAIGQGEVTATPLQICNLAATIANRGYFYTPHIVKSIQDTILDTSFTKRRYTGIRPELYTPVVEGMRAAVAGSPAGQTCRGAWMPDIAICGKTGTAQNIGPDHSIFMGFAPMDNPKVAIALIVESGGFGAENAVPIGRLMIEKYLKKEIPESSKPLESMIKSRKILPPPDAL